MSIAISVEDLTFTYRGNEEPAIADIRLQLEDGEFVVLMGHGGAGKSTLCYCFNGLIPKFFKGEYKGRVLVKGREVAEARVPDMARIVGLVFQDFEAQLFSTNVELEVAFGPENYGLPREEIRRRVEEYLSFVRLQGLRHREPASLSGGQKQRLAIASVLALEPDILVMDEPTTDLDPLGREEVLSVADDLARQKRTLLVVDHEPETAEKADRVFLMKEGRLKAQGPAREILSQVSLLRDCGVRPPQVAELFQRLGWPEAPVTVEEALYLLRKEKGINRLPVPGESRPPSGPVILETRGLSFVYPEGNVEALRDVNLQVRAGEFLAIIGQNGSGKTTLVKHFNGLLRPTQGQVLVEGKDTRRLSPGDLAFSVGYVFQNPDHQIFAPTVWEEVAFGPRNFGMPEDEVARRVAEALRAVHLEGYEERDPFALTKGERQRVAVASVLAMRPKVIILDEPTTGLDYPQQQSMMAMLEELNRAGHTVIIVTHSMWVVTRYAARTVVMQDGRIILDGSTRQVFAQEEELASTALRPPPIVRLGHRLGTKALTVEELAQLISSQT